jgi:uncharacterized protein
MIGQPLTRISHSEKEAILQNVSSFAPGSEVYLFGSRTRPEDRGGDIDLLVLTDTKLPLSRVRAMRRSILSKIGEQKLDIVNFPRDAKHPFKDIALAGSVRL